MYLRSKCLILVLAVFGLSAASTVRAQSTPEKTAHARQILLDHGLVPSGNNLWLTRQEASLKRLADSLDALERRHQQAIVKADEALASNESIRVRLAAAEAAERTKKGLPAPNKQEQPPNKPSLNSPPDANPPQKLDSQMPDVTGLGEQTPLQQAMIDLVNARTSVQLVVLAIRRDAGKIDAGYDPIKSDNAIRTALKQVGTKARLGPARNYARDLAKANSFAESIFQREIPGYFESGQFRVPALLNEVQPVTFSFHPQDGPLLLAASVGQRLSLSDKSFSESPQEVEVSGRRLMARPVKLASLRLGPVVLKDVSALVLPPEAEDLGSHLSASTLSGLRTSLQPRRMTLAIEPRRDD